jgi:hypothetical protein
MKEILDAVGFFHEIRKQLRFGEFSRLPLRVLRFEVKGDAAECDWFMRPPDPWDVHLPTQLQEEHLTQQSLRDALKIRELIFRAFPQVERAELRMYRQAIGEPAADGAELMMTGTVLRETEVLARVASVVMRAKLYGFRFSLDGGALERVGSNGVHASC